MDTMTKEQVQDYFENMPDEVLQKVSFSVPWQVVADPDGFDVTGIGSKDYDLWTYKDIQEECWKKFNRSPHIRTAVTDTMGRLCGNGFGVYSDIEEIQDAIDLISEDPRNRLHTFMPKYVARADVEGELFHCFTVHPDGFIEIDFRDPGTVTDIHFHPTKPTMPLLYEFSGQQVPNSTNIFGKEQVPSIFIADYPDLLKLIEDKINPNLIADSKHISPKYRKLNGFYRFIVAWDKGFLTSRNISYVNTILEWLNHYETLKKYEIDHKKSSGAYVWAFKCTDPRMFRIWLSMSDEEKAKTGITAKKTPGSTIVLPPGFEMVAVNPNLTKISNTDTDILSMVIAGLNKPADVVTGEPTGTFASSKATRGPLSDRYSDEIAYFERYLRFDFWRAIFLLKNKVVNFPEFFKLKVAVGFDSNKNPIMKFKKFRPHQLLEFAFPTSHVDDMESVSKALLGVKHGRLSKVLGIPSAEVAKRLGFQNYRRLRLSLASEESYYPDLEPDVDAESAQEIQEGELAKTGIRKKAKMEDGKNKTVEKKKLDK